jgi:LDH2 family malate/lactate/ureidoglycolate dehydrogenase
MDLVTLTVAELEQRVESIFCAAGLDPEQARAMARTVAAGERDGCASHGIYRVEGCLATIRAGKVATTARPVLRRDGPAIVRVEAGGGFAPAAFELGAPALAEAALDTGLAALVINDCVHFAALWPEVEAIAERGLAALALCPSYSAVAPTGGTAALFGTNPLAFGWPRPGGEPYVFDFATSVAARGEVELRHRVGESVPEGWAVDAEGRSTTDPAQALKGALLPFGGHKGSAISTMVELLGGAMIGDLLSPEALTAMGNAPLPRHGELVLALDPRRLSAGRPSDPFARAEALFAAILGQGARLPSQRRFAARARSLAQGITLEVDQVARLEALARPG